MNTRRRRLASGVWFVIAALVLVAAAPAPPSQAVLFSDTFSDGNDAGWTQVNRFWQVTDGHYLLTSDYLPNSIGRNGYAVTHVGDTKWRNYLFQATFDNTNADGYPPEVHEAEFLVRVITPPPFGDWWNGRGHGTFYVIAVWPKGTVDPTGQGRPFPDGDMGIMKFVDGVQTANVERQYSNTVVGTNTIAIKVDGPTIRVTINGENVLTWKDDNQPLMYGGIGVGGIWEVNPWFDNVTVLRGGLPGK